MDLRTWDDVDAAGLKIGELEREVGTAEIKRDDAIAEAKKLYKEESATPAKEAKALREQIADFFWEHPEDRDEGAPKTKTLEHVKVEERTTEKIKWPSPLQKVLDKLHKLGLVKFIRTKEEVDKDGINKQATDVEKKKLGLVTISETVAYTELL